MTVYYQMTYCSEEDYKSFGVAYAPEDADIFLLPKSGELIKSWEPITLQLIDGGYADYLSNDLGGRLCSESLRNVIDSVKSTEDEIQWLDVRVFWGQMVKSYYFLHFPKNFPVVDEKKSIMVDDMVVKPVLNALTIKKHMVFTIPNDVGRTIFVSSELKDTIEQKKLTGISFFRI